MQTQNILHGFFFFFFLSGRVLFLMLWLSEGELLAMMEKNSRDFLYPNLTVFDREGKAEQEAFMKRSSTFPVSCLSFVSNRFPANTARYVRLPAPRYSDLRFVLIV